MILLLLLLVLGVTTSIVANRERRRRYWALTLGLSSFSLLTILNLQWPDFAPMGERLRDYAILSAVMHDPIAPQEPWFNGFPLNYYLNWYRLAALPGLIGFAPWEIYHLAGPVTMAIGITCSAMLLVSLTGSTPLVSSTVAVSLWLGSNIAGLVAVFYGDHSWWGPSRVLFGAINEFPAWSWLLGDLHPHFLNLCALPVVFFAARRLSGWTYCAALVCWCAWNYSANAWDTAPALVVAVVLAMREGRSLRYPARNWSTTLALLGVTGLFVLSALHIDAPHAPVRLLDFRVPELQATVELAASYSPLKIEPHTPGVFGSRLGEFLLHWGFAFGLIVLGFLRRLDSIPKALAVGLAAIAVLYSNSVALLLIVTALLVAGFERFKFSRIRALLVAMLLVILVPEIIFLDDPYGGESERMNTIFKFYSFAWIPFGISAWCWMAWRMSPRTRLVCVSLLAAMMLPWTVQTIGDRRQTNFVLLPKAQGLSHFERTYPGSGKAIQRLVVMPRGVTIEAENGAYSDGAFVSTLASQPSFLGWANHVGLLLKNPPELGRRQGVIKEFYEGDCAAKRTILQREGITYAVFGPIEQRAFPQTNRESFSCLSAVIEEETVVVYGAS